MPKYAWGVFYIKKEAQMDVETLMAQAADLQSKISAAQDSLAKQHVRGIGGKGAVVVTMTGKYDVLSVVVQPGALESGAENVSRYVFDAYKDAKEKADILIEKTMNAVTGSLNE